MATEVAIGERKRLRRLVSRRAMVGTFSAPRPTGPPTIAPPNMELKMARTIVSLGLFSAVALFAGAMTAGGLSFTADTVAKVAATTPVKTTNLKPSYIAYMPTVKAEAL